MFNSCWDENENLLFHLTHTELYRDVEHNERRSLSTQLMHAAGVQNVK